MIDSMVARLSGNVSYSDNTSSAFAADIDELYDLHAVGRCRDAVEILTEMINMLGGSLTLNTHPSGKVVNYVSLHFSFNGLVDNQPVSCIASYNTKDGYYTSQSITTAYQLAITRFNTLFTVLFESVTGYRAVIQ